MYFVYVRTCILVEIMHLVCVLSFSYIYVCREPCKTKRSKHSIRSIIVYMYTIIDRDLCAVMLSVIRIRSYNAWYPND